MSNNIIEITQQTKGLLIFNLYEEVYHARIRYYINLEEYELVVTGETTASYKWVSGTKESFIDLLLRSDYGYILMKLGYSRPKVFNLNKSIEETIKEIKDNYYEDLDEDIRDDFLTNIKSIDVATSEGFYKDMCSLIENYELRYLDLHECINVVENYPHWLVRSVDLFFSDIKPLLKECDNNEKES